SARVRRALHSFPTRRSSDLVAVHAVDGAGLLDALPAGGGAAQAVHPDLHKVGGGGAVQVQDVADDGLAGDLEGLAVVVLADGIENIKHGVYPLHCIVLRTAFIIPQTPALLQVSRSQKEPPPPKAAGALLGYNLVLLDPSEAVGAVDGAVLTGLEGNLAGLAAGCADSVVHLALAGRGGTGAVLAGVTASLAALGLVLKAAGCVELLLAGSPNKLLAAVLTN